MKLNHFCVTMDGGVTPYSESYSCLLWFQNNPHARRGHNVRMKMDNPWSPKAAKTATTYSDDIVSRNDYFHIKQGRIKLSLFYPTLESWRNTGLHGNVYKKQACQASGGGGHGKFVLHLIYAYSKHLMSSVDSRTPALSCHSFCL